MATGVGAARPSSAGRPADHDLDDPGAADQVGELARRPVRALSAFRDRVRARPGGTLGWRIGVTVVGVAVVVGGVVLLPLPGPGWLIIFAGLGVLATEYEWAARLLRFAREQVSRWTAWIGRQPLWLRGVLGLLTAVAIAAAAVLAWEIYR